MEGRQRVPVSLAFHVERHLHLCAAGCGEQVAPRQGVEAERTVFVGFGNQFFATADEVCHGFICLVFHHEIKRGDVGRSGDVAIVGIDVSHLFERSGLFGKL